MATNLPRVQDLLPCPFCGLELEPPCGDHPWNGCILGGLSVGDRAEAWNRRSPPVLSQHSAKLAEQRLANLKAVIAGHLEWLGGAEDIPATGGNPMAREYDSTTPEKSDLELPAPEIPERLREALRWAEKFDSIEANQGEGGVCFDLEGANEKDRSAFYAWVFGLVNDRLRLARDVAAGRKKACRFAGAIDSEGDYGVSGWTPDGRDCGPDLSGDASYSRGTVYLTVPETEVVEAETDE